MNKIVAATAAFALCAASYAALPAGAQEADEAEAVEVAEMARGAEDAPVEVIEYASFTCPHCSTFHQEVLPQLKSDYIDEGKVRFVYREVYFDPYGLWASLLARCGGEERYFGIVDLLYEKQSEWLSGGTPAEITENLRRIGRSAGLGNDEIDACMQDEAKAKALVAAYQKNAGADGIDSTPSFVIDGELYANMPYDRFSEILDEKLEE